jgi:hypothetical protein
MPEVRSNLAAMLVLLALTPFCLLGVQEVAASAQAHGGIVGELVGELKHEHDEAELSEIRERAPQTREEREEAREQSEQAQVQSTEEGTMPAPEQGEAG